MTEHRTCAGAEETAGHRQRAREPLRVRVAVVEAVPRVRRSGQPAAEFEVAVADLEVLLVLVRELPVGWLGRGCQGALQVCSVIGAHQRRLDVRCFVAAAA